MVTALVLCTCSFTCFEVAYGCGPGNVLLQVMNIIRSRVVCVFVCSCMFKMLCGCVRSFKTVWRVLAVCLPEGHGRFCQSLHVHVLYTT